MKQLRVFTDKYIAIILAICAVIVSVSIVLLFYFLECKNIIAISICMAIGLAITIYFLARHFMKILVIEKVRPIYKIIRSAQVPRFKDLINSNEHLIEAAERDSQTWVQQKSDEVEFLKRQETFRKEYIGNVAHELKTPIFTIQGYVSTLLDGGLHDESINRKYLERTDKIIQRMTSIVHDLDAITRLESGELKMEYSTFNLCDLISDIFESQEYVAKEHNVTLSMENTLPRPIMVYADKMRMTMALSNLIVNGIKYNKPEGGTVLIRFYDMDSRYLVEVSDTGIGIPKEYQERIFERFFRVDKSRSREQGGTGLGLAIVKHVIEAHGETLNIKSTLNEGTSFSFTIKKGNIR